MNFLIIVKNTTRKMKQSKYLIKHPNKGYACSDSLTGYTKQKKLATRFSKIDATNERYENETIILDSLKEKKC